VYQLMFLKIENHLA